MLTAIRDNRSICHKDPSLVTIQTNSGNGPIYFNCCPNYSVDTNNPWKKIQVHIRELSRNFAFTRRVYLKFLSFQLNPKFILKLSLDETKILKSNQIMLLLLPQSY